MSDSKAFEIAALSFTKDWTDPSAFPTYEPNETQVRADMQYLFNEIKTYLNDTIIPAVRKASTMGDISDGYVADIYLSEDNHLIAEMSDGEVVDFGEFGAVAQTIINQSVITQNLYAENGDIANLTVDSLSTSRRVVRYLAGNTDDDNYIHAEDQYLKFMTGTTDGSSVQHTDRAGRLLYWEKDITGAALNALGYPEIDGKQVVITTEVTEWPVMVYQYTELCKLEMAFANVENDGTEHYIPAVVLGAGDGNGNAKGYIYKLTDKLRVDYVKSDGTKVSVTLSDDGVQVEGAGDAKGLRNIITVPESEFDESASYGSEGDIVAVVED